MYSDRFTPHIVIEILRDLLRNEASGTLSMHSDSGESVRIDLRCGLIDFGSRPETWGEFLGRLEALGALPSPLPEALSDPELPATRLASALGERQTDPEVLKEVRAETHRAVRAAFTMSGGSFSFTESAETSQFDPDVPATIEMLLRGMDGIARWAVVRRVLQAQQRALKPAAVALFPVERLRLAPDEGYLLSLMDGRATYADLSSLYPGDPDRLTCFVFAALVLGVVEFEPSLVQPFCLDAYSDKSKEEKQREEKEVERIEKWYALARGTEPHARLGLTVQASWAEVQRAYQEARAALQPEAFSEAVRHRKREDLRFIHAALLASYMEIQSRMVASAGEVRGRRAEVAVNLGDMQGRRLESQKTEKQAAIESKVRQANDYLSRAQAAFGQGDWHAAIGLCEEALKHDEKLAEGHALLADALTRNPARRWQLRAEQAYKRALTLDPWNPRFYLRIADFYRRQGLEQRAVRFEMRAYEIAPSLREVPEASA